MERGLRVAVGDLSKFLGALTKSDTCAVALSGEETEDKSVQIITKANTLGGHLGSKYF